MDKYDAINILEEIQTIDDGLGQYINGFDEAIDIGIKAIQNEISLVAELEQIKAKIRRLDCIYPSRMKLESMKIVDEYIKKMKGES